MERDFLGLSSKNAAMAAFREEFQDASKNSALGMQWSFSNKVCALPHLMSFKAAQDHDKQRKINVDPLQKNVLPDNKAGNGPFAMAVYPFQNADALSLHRMSNQPTNAVAFNVPVFQSQAVVGSNVNLQPFGGVPIATSISVPFASSVVGTTELRNASKPPGSIAQLTIFYAGSVCVYNDISPEKAQAIMLLAGNSGLPQTQNNMHSTAQMKASFPLSLAQSKVGSCSNIELPATKPIQTSASHHNHSEPPRDASSVAPTFIPTAVPQARKASLARFLEKRKERINTCPYTVAKKTSDCSSTTLDLMA